jgi:hypothetical protein
MKNSVKKQRKNTPLPLEGGGRGEISFGNI